MAGGYLIMFGHDCAKCLLFGHFKRDRSYILFVLFDKYFYYLKLLIEIPVLFLFWLGSKSVYCGNWQWKYFETAIVSLWG
jgi:hypothetical protein